MGRGEGRASDLFLSVAKPYAFRGRLRQMMAAVVECLSVSQLCFFVVRPGETIAELVLRETITNWRLRELRNNAKKLKKGVAR